MTVTASIWRSWRLPSRRGRPTAPARFFSFLRCSRCNFFFFAGSGSRCDPGPPRVRGIRLEKGGGLPSSAFSWHQQSGTPGGPSGRSMNGGQ